MNIKELEGPKDGWAFWAAVSHNLSPVYSVQLQEVSSYIIRSQMLMFCCAQEYLTLYLMGLSPFAGPGDTCPCSH